MPTNNTPLHFNTEKQRFEMTVDGKQAFIDYKQKGETMYLVHTEVDEALEGEGVAADLVQKTLEYLDEHRLKLVPTCSYVQHYLDRHPEWKKLVAEN